MSSALATLSRLGIRVRLGPGGQVQVGPRDRVTDEARDLVRRHADEIRAALTRYRVWTLTLIDGTRLTAINPRGATRSEMLNHENNVFGPDRVVAIEPERESEITN